MMYIIIDGKRKAYIPNDFCNYDDYCRCKNNTNSFSDVICHLCKYFKPLDIPKEFEL